jgi:hypothetical protein
MGMFDYISFANSLSIGSEVVKLLEQEAKDEFPNDSISTGNLKTNPCGKARAWRQSPLIINVPSLK